MQKKLFVIIQPLQYLQALELRENEDICELIIPWATENNQIKKIINEDDWDNITYLKYRGTLLEILLNRTEIKKIIKKSENFDEIIVSSYWNPLMNLLSNSVNNAKKIILEDGSATLLLGSSKEYESLKYQIKYLFCRLLGFNISPINKPILFLLNRNHNIEIPKLASGVFYNNFQKLRSNVSDYRLDDSFYFISSSFINAKMISRESYIIFLKKLSLTFSTKPLKIILHRFDKFSDFSELDRYKNIELIQSDGPVELYFQKNSIKPSLLITSGSGATETLDLIYKFQVIVYLPMIEMFYKGSRAEIRALAKHMEKSYTVNFL